MNPNPAQQVLQVTTGYVASAALYAAMNLNIAEHLAAGPQDVADLARITKADEDALFRILRLLASHGIFTEVSPRRYALTPAAELLRGDLPQSLRGIAFMLADPLHFKTYANLMHSVMTRKPALEQVVGMPLFDYLAKDAEYSKIFNEAMVALSAPVIGAALEAYDFGQFGLVVDVGAGLGEVLLSILQQHSNVRGVLTDLPHVVEAAKPRIAGAGLAHRCHAVPCDFFVSVPEGGDAYVMKHIIHDWDDARATTILKNVAKAIGNRNGKVILLDSVIAAGDAPDLGKAIDLEMLVFPGGRERSAEEFRALLAGAGFEMTRIVPTKSPLSIVEAVRA